MKYTYATGNASKNTRSSLRNARNERAVHHARHDTASAPWPRHNRMSNPCRAEQSLKQICLLGILLGVFGPVLLWMTMGNELWRRCQRRCQQHGVDAMSHNSSCIVRTPHPYKYKMKGATKLDPEGGLSLPDHINLQTLSCPFAIWSLFIERTPSVIRDLHVFRRKPNPKLFLGLTKTRSWFNYLRFQYGGGAKFIGSPNERNEPRLR